MGSTGNTSFAPSFFESLTALSATEQAVAIKFVLKFYKDQRHPSNRLKRIPRTRKAWSARVNEELRAILFYVDDGFVLAHVGHHDPAYKWAERHSCQKHPATHVLQSVPSQNPTINKSATAIGTDTHAAGPDSKIFEPYPDELLCSLGVPKEWLLVLRELRSSDALWETCLGSLPDEVFDRLDQLSQGKIPPPVAPKSRQQGPNSTREEEASVGHTRPLWPSDQSLLEAVLEWPFDQWIAFPHPSQSTLIEREYRGPAKISGSAGTGKTVVAMHRARWLARRGNQVLVTTFATGLCESIRRNLKKFCDKDDLNRITVLTVIQAARGIVEQDQGRIGLIFDDEVDPIIEAKCRLFDLETDVSFAKSEWRAVVRAQGLETWEEYRKAVRSGRSRPLSSAPRESFWRVFESVLNEFDQRNILDRSGMANRAQKLLEENKVRSHYSAIVVDEVQDLRPPELRFLLALAGDYAYNFMVCGDTSQRIYQGGFSLHKLGIETRGRAHILRLNYRTTRQISTDSEQLLGHKHDDMEGSLRPRKAARSLRSGPNPQYIGFSNWEDEVVWVLEKIRKWQHKGDEIGVFARTRGLVNKICDTLSSHDISFTRLSDKQGPAGISVGTMHAAKGLEFRFVLIVACSYDVIPSRGALRSALDPTVDIEDRERRLLYVAMTRARDELTVTWHGKPSKFLDLIPPSRQGLCTNREISVVGAVNSGCTP